MHDDFAPRALASPASYERRRTEVFWLTFVGYVACYFVRNNTAVASGLLVLEEGWTPLDVGVVLTGFTVTSGWPSSSWASSWTAAVSASATAWR